MKKEIKIRIYFLAIFGVLLMLLSSCSKKSDSSNSTPTSTTINDVDGNTYHTVTIGTQTWMVENLKTTKYNDGTAIPLVTDSAAWVTRTTPGYCWYNNDAATYQVTYGALYNWYAVNTGKLAPKGWHVPSDAEWTTLTTYLGGDTIAGGKLKETDTIHWQSPNKGATNETGFTALPGGYRNGYGTYSGTFNGIGKGGRWVSSTEYDTILGLAWVRSMVGFSKYVFQGRFPKESGSSVRCLRD